MIDFTKAQIGQPVTCLVNGKGKVDLIQENNYPIKVVFDSGRWENFTSDGRLYREYNPSLIVGHHDLPKLDQGELPEPEHKTLDFHGIPRWAYVSDGTYKDAELRGRRHVVAGNSDTSWCAVTAEKTNTESGSIAHWKYAWEIEDD